jgi:hypothetical protein
MLVRTRGQKAGMLGFTRTGTSIPGFPLLKARQPSHRGGHGLSYSLPHLWQGDGDTPRRLGVR